MGREKKLYHYTSQFGFLGIIRSEGVWASNAGFLNDSSECSHVYDIAEQIVDAVLEQDDYQSVFLHQMRSALRVLDSPNLFITSFSERADLLSQWRGYCPGGAGMCVGFEFEQIRAYCEERGYRLERCIYDGNTLTHSVGELIDQCWERFPHPPLGRSDFAALSPSQAVDFMHEYQIKVTAGDEKLKALTAIRWFCDELSQLAPLYKNEGFHEEAEWRIVVKEPSTPLSYRAGLSCLIPYIELNVLAEKSTLLEVVVGPNPDQMRCMRSAEMALESFGYHQVLVYPSGIPFNNW